MKTVITTVLILFSTVILAEVARYPLPNNSTFPISQAVEVKAGTTLVFHSGTVPGAANSEAERFSREFWGDTKTQAISVFNRIEGSLKDKGLGMGDVIKMTVFLVGVPENNGRMDFSGFMEAYTQYFGTKNNPIYQHVLQFRSRTLQPRECWWK